MTWEPKNKLDDDDVDVSDDDDKDDFRDDKTGKHQYSLSQPSRLIFNLELRHVHQLKL